MKKFYTLILAAAVAFAASATAPQTLDLQSEFNTNKFVPAKQKTELKFNFKKLAQNQANKIGVKVAIEDIEGEYEWTYYSALGQGGWGSSTAQIDIVDADAGSVTLTLAEAFVLEGTFANGKLSLAPGQDLGYDSYNQMQVYFYHKRWNEAGNGVVSSEEPLVASASYDDNDMVIFSFDEDDLIMIGNETVGWFLAAYLNEMAPYSEWEDRLMPEEGWEKYSTSTFTDGWQLAGYGVDPVTMPYDVVVEKNTSAEYDGVELYRIVNPYGPNTPLYQYNTDPNDGKGYILFSLMVPQFVMALPMTYSGLEDEYGSYLNYNFEGYGYIFGDVLFEDNPNWTLQDIVDAFELEEISTYENNLVTFQNCCFSDKMQPTSPLIWQDEQGNPIIYPSTLTLPSDGNDGVDSVNADFDGTVKYYNLQGIQVENPGNGIYIKQEGGKTFKVRVVR